MLNEQINECIKMLPGSGATCHFYLEIIICAITVGPDSQRGLQMPQDQEAGLFLPYRLLTAEHSPAEGGQPQAHTTH